MVNLKYSALYTDNSGCEQALVCFSKGEFQLKVRGCTFKSRGLNFDFYANNSKKINQLFYLKDDELIEYVIDIKIPLTLVCDNSECIKEFLLRVERHKSYYSNSLSINLDGIVYKVKGYDFQELIINIKKELPKEYSMECSLLNMFNVFNIKTNNQNNYNPFKSFKGEHKINSDKDSYLNLFSYKGKKEFNKLQKVSITYICDEYCLS